MIPDSFAHPSGSSGVSLNPIPNGPGLLVSVKTGLGGKDWVLEAGGWVIRREKKFGGLEEKKGGGGAASVTLS